MQRNGSPHVLLMESSYAATLLTVWQFLLFRFFLEEGRGGGGRNFLIDKNKTKQKPNYTCTAIEKGQFSFQSQRKAMPKNAQTTAQLHSSHMLVKRCSKFSSQASAILEP